MHITSNYYSYRRAWVPLYITTIVDNPIYIVCLVVGVHIPEGDTLGFSLSHSATYYHY